jgi:hypothetical protein
MGWNREKGVEVRTARWETRLKEEGEKHGKDAMQTNQPRDERDMF